MGPGPTGYSPQPGRRLSLFTYCTPSSLILPHTFVLYESTTFDFNRTFSPVTSISSPARACYSCFSIKCALRTKLRDRKSEVIHDPPHHLRTSHNPQEYPRLPGIRR